MKIFIHFVIGLVVVPTVVFMLTGQSEASVILATLSFLGYIYLAEKEGWGN